MSVSWNIASERVRVLSVVCSPSTHGAVSVSHAPWNWSHLHSPSWEAQVFTPTEAHPEGGLGECLGHGGGVCQDGPGPGTGGCQCHWRRRICSRATRPCGAEAVVEFSIREGESPVCRLQPFHTRCRFCESCSLKLEFVKIEPDDSPRSKRQKLDWFSDAHFQLALSGPIAVPDSQESTQASHPCIALGGSGRGGGRGRDRILAGGGS